MSATTECDDERLSARQISSAEIIRLLLAALEKFGGPDYEFHLGQLQYYRSFEPIAIFDSASDIARNAGHGDLHFDLYTLGTELEEGVSSPIMLLRTISTVLAAISVAEDRDQ